MSERKSGHATGMAGEFFVMERLFRLGHEPALTLGNAKHIDILVETKTGDIKTLSVKAIRGGGKWPVGKSDLSTNRNMIFVFLLYKNFADVQTDPDVWIMPAKDAESRKRAWFDGYAIYYSHAKLGVPDLNSYKDAWHYV